MLARLLLVSLLTSGASVGLAQLRVSTFNISNYSGGRTADIQTAVYAAYQGRSWAPDAILGQEFTSASALDAFRNALNSAPNSPRDWASAPFVAGPDTNQVLLYRTSRLTFVRQVIVATGSSDNNNQPRNTMRYDLELSGYVPGVPGASISLYNSHMKAGSTNTDQDRRLVEAVRIRDNAQSLPTGTPFALGADLNIQASTQAAYEELVGTQANNLGRFFDPIATPGNWNNVSTFRFVHTQDPVGAGGMDDRFDQILLSQSLIDGNGFDYVGTPFQPYSTTTWNDPFHSYRCWGNDGTSFDNPLNIATNQMVGPTIAQALVNLAAGAGHLPVFLDLRVPPKTETTVLLDFGRVLQNRVAIKSIEVANTGDESLWGVGGVADLRYSMTASSGFTVASGNFTEPAGGGINTHAVAMDTRTPGSKSGTITIQTNAPERPTIVIQLRGFVIPPSRLGPR